MNPFATHLDCELTGLDAAQATYEVVINGGMAEVLDHGPGWLLITSDTMVKDAGSDARRHHQDRPHRHRGDSRLTIPLPK